MRRAAAALVLALGVVARAGDPSATIDLRAPTRWKAGEVVTASVMESTRSKTSVGDSMPERELETKLESTFVLRCLEADPQGKPLRSLARVDSWSMKGAARDDRCLEGALVEISSAGWTLVAASTNPSRAARGWLNTRFGTHGRGFSGGFAELASPGPLAAGASWTADPPAIAKGLVEGEAFVRTDPRKWSKWKFGLAQIGSSAAGATAKVSFDETFPLSGESTLGDVPITVAEGSSVRAHGEYVGVPGLWHRTGRMRTTSEKDLDTTAGAMSIKFHIVSAESEAWDAGGVAPEAPKAAGAVTIGADERWAVGDTMLESGATHGTVVATPVLEDGKDGAPERIERTTTWSAEVECVEAYSDHWPKALTIVLREWTSTQGDETDRSLTGVVLRVSRDGFKIASGGDGASSRAKEWLNARYGQGVRREDPTRDAVTPVMRVAPKQSWTSDGYETASAIRGRFDYPLETESVQGKGTFVGAKGDVVSIAYEVEASISCVPGCNGAGADILKGTIRVKGTADGPTANWTRLGSLQDSSDVSITLPGQNAAEETRRLAITETRRIARSPLANRSAKSWTQSAVAKIDRRDFDGAIADCTKAIGVDAKCADAWFNRARAKASKRDAAGAIADYTKAIEIDPKLAAAYNNRGLQKRALGDPDGAIADYDRAIEASPRYAPAFRNRGVVKAGKGDFEGAIADYDTAIEIRPKYVEAFNDRGLAHYNRREYAAAVEDYTKAAELAPKEALYVVNRANAKSAMGDLDGALADHDAAIAIDPANSRAYYFRADVRGRKGDAKGARDDYDQAIELDPKFASNWNDRGILRQDQGDVDGAIADFTKAMDLDPRDSHAWFNRARSRAAKGDLDGAIADCTKALEIDPKYAAAYNRRAGYRLDWGDDDGAVADWTKAVEADPRYAAAHFSIGRAKLAPGLPPAPAVAELRKSLENNDDTDYERLWLCLARAWSGEGPAAAKELADYAAARKSSGPDDWYPVLVGLLTGTKTEDAAIAAAKAADAKTSRERLCEATFYAGVLRAIRGDVAKAVELFDRCLATDVRTFTEFEEARRRRPALLLGATTRAVDESAARRVVSPDPCGPLAQSGLRDGDLITGIDGRPLTPGRLDELLLASRPGTTVHVDFSRAGGAQRADVTLGAWRPR